MKEHWTSYKAWIAHFDILGFKSILENENGSLITEVIKSIIDDTLKELENNVSEFKEQIGYLFYADTFLIYSRSEQVKDYPSLISISKRFINNCIYKKLPVRGALSYGEISIGHDKRILMGKAFLESHIYGEDQNWIGLILTPSATEELEKNKLFPSRHGFINQDIPLRKHSIFDERVYAYRFSNGSTNFECALLPALNQMMMSAPEGEKIKFENTIKFIQKHYNVHKNS